MVGGTTPFAFYGTLMRGDPVMDRLGRFGGGVRLRGDLYDVGGLYPALVAGDGVVDGRLWRPLTVENAIDATELFDRIEGYDPADTVGSHYVRRLTPLLWPEAYAWVYYYNRSVRGLPRIVHGSWARRSRGL